MLNCFSKRRKIKDIKITKDFKDTTPSLTKLIRKTAEYVQTGNIDKIIIDQNNTLLDGYCSYLILKALEVESAKVVIVREDKR